MSGARRAVVFDMDGLMLDTERVALECWLDTARDAGWEITRDDCLAMVGLDQRASERALMQRVGQDFPLREISDRAKEVYLRRLRSEGIGLKPGLTALLDWLAAHSVPVAVATSTRHLLAVEKLELAGLSRRFEVVVCGDQVPEGKPAPHVYLEAVAQLGLQPAACVALEDSDIGLRAAHAAGLACIVVPDLRPPAAGYAPLAHAVVPTLREAHPLVGELLGLPAGAEAMPAR
ncbi:HAD family phosphatase [Burkholderiaceae bacterium FT117]|uniref:HAD family hydrolase n=1 Tax=Zeimonas sediminis TaxID=2944268 RepID=UPI002342E211|nr:HAD family phosphatase [Zeimonas sediminis]MCM5572101.1 HAD family phosphatase [Zeimonas sediminis]